MWLSRRDARNPAFRRAAHRRGRSRHARGLWRRDEVRRGQKMSWGVVRAVPSAADLPQLRCHDVGDSSRSRAIQSLRRASGQMGRGFVSTSKRSTSGFSVQNADRKLSRKKDNAPPSTAGVSALGSVLSEVSDRFQLNREAARKASKARGARVARVRGGGERGEGRLATHGMECACGAAKRQRVSTVESALASIDVLGQLAAFLEAGELCQVRATCKALGSRDDSAFDGLSMTEEAARRIYESASDEEKAMLPRHDGEGWIELYRHLLMLRARLTFDQLVGSDVEYQEGDKAAVRTMLGTNINGFPNDSSAICGNHIMRAGKHWVTFVLGGEDLGHLGLQSVGVIRPLPGWDQTRLDDFHPSDQSIWYDLRRERTSRWEGDVHFCHFYQSDGRCFYSNWEGDSTESIWDSYNNYERGIGTLGMLLDLDIGTLSVYRNGQKVGTLKDGLAGVYCWIASFGGSWKMGRRRVGGRRVGGGEARGGDRPDRRRDGDNEEEEKAKVIELDNAEEERATGAKSPNEEDGPARGGETETVFISVMTLHFLHSV
ncbi:hypothetical protein THAOC_07210 [Thalassiosira oceanica]|uniref:B30.2/SPRY domain-containing protein n=1 Tax=Thalassiosira oceanica TaxID=159749 RepID=K0T0W1_THAOC|nr:hypothetical protein THAOC_07210 [Thalassiosira oceanica]|eukprot:EJK71365.1 hypothetical protein THAOC_07210 [Thalassiosira oceanica]